MNKDRIAALEAGLGLIGCALLVYGISQWSTPCGYVAAGIILIMVAIWPASKPEKVAR